MTKAFLLGGVALLVAAPALAQTAAAPTSVDEIRALRAELDRQAAVIAAQRARLDALENEVLAQQRGRQAAPVQSANSAAGAAAPQAASAAGAAGTQVAQASPNPVAGQPVGVAPGDAQPMADVAVLSDSGGIITRAGRLTIEPGFEYARSDRNRVIFRGIEVPTAVLVGALDINEVRQDVLTASLGFRYGLSSRFELNARVPYVYRNDVSILAPVANGSQGISPGANSQSGPSARGNNLGDVEFGVRYQLTNGGGGFPFLIAGLSAVAPTGTSPFNVPRDALGVAQRSATGGGFWGLTPSITALLPSDPAVLFGTLGYTRNFGRSFNNAPIGGDVFVNYVKPGDAIVISAGLGVSLNPRVAFSLGYAHNWAFGTFTRGESVTQSGVPPFITVTRTPFSSTLRDLQIGRFLFGVSYRVSPRTTINWNLEVGATRDAPDVRTTLRIPFTFGS